MKEHNVQIQSWAPYAEGKNNIFQNDVLVSIALHHNKSVAQIISRWLIQRNVIVIPKSLRKEWTIENINIFDFELTQEDMERISTLDTKQSLFFSHNNGPETMKIINKVKHDMK